MSQSIFISYCREDEKYAFKLSNELVAKGFSIWIDKKIGSGTLWAHEIEEQLKNCAAFIVIMTPRAAKSVWVQNELSKAIELKKPIIPFLLEGDQWLSVQAIQHVDVRENQMPSSSFYTLLEQYESPVGLSQTKDTLSSETSGSEISFSRWLRSIPVPYLVACAAIAIFLFFLIPERLVPAPLTQLKVLTGIATVVAFGFTMAWRDKLVVYQKWLASALLISLISLIILNVMYVRPVNYQNPNRVIYFITGNEIVEADLKDWTAEEIIRTVGPEWDAMKLAWGRSFEVIAICYTLSYLMFVLGLILTMGSTRLARIE